MKTARTTSPEVAAEHIRRGGLVGFPTETVYGLGADALDAGAVARIFEAKRRPVDNPLIVHLAEPSDVERVATAVSPAAQRMIDAFFPGPLTLVFTRRPEVPPVTSGGLDTIAVRCPALELTRAFLTACRTPVAAPSANLSGRPSPTTWRAVLEDLDGRIDCVLQGPPAEHGLESTVLDCTGDEPLVLRPGALSLESLRVIAPETRLVDPMGAEHVRSPGTRYRHYAPDARIVLIRHPDEIRIAPERSAYIGVDPVPDGLSLARTKICQSEKEYASQLYGFFRACDGAGVDTIYCQRVPSAGIGRALSDRLKRAANASASGAGTRVSDHERGLRPE